MKAEAELRRLHAVEKNSSGGCACRWDAEGDRVATCERHQGWLEVIVEWADRAREAEKKLKALTQREPGDDPCPGCFTGHVCRTPSCGRLKLPLDHPYRAKATGGAA